MMKCSSLVACAGIWCSPQEKRLNALIGGRLFALVREGRVLLTHSCLLLEAFLDAPFPETVNFLWSGSTKLGLRAEQTLPVRNRALS